MRACKASEILSSSSKLSNKNVKARPSLFLSALHYNWPVIPQVIEYGLAFCITRFT
jgi:hypothetical protein